MISPYHCSVRRIGLLACALLLLLTTALVPGVSAAETVKVADRSRCMLPPGVQTAAPVGVGACPGVRPGAFFTSPVAGCTFNFLFQGNDGYRYIGSAGHCLLDQSGFEVWPVGEGPVVQASGSAVGRGAYAKLKGERDFGLIRLDPGTKANPQMCHFGGPTGMDDELMNGPVVLEHYGNGLAVSELAPARTSVALNTRNPDTVSAIGLASFGDSGSGATRAGRALGVVVAIGVGSGNVFLTRVAPQVAEAEQALGIRLTLQTASRR